jgi:glutathione S-transferase
MAEFTVHSVPGSPYGRAVLATLEEKGASWRLLMPAEGGMKGEAHMRRHPFGRIPVLEHGDFSLYETQAILRYLDRIFPSPALTPTDAKAAARMDQVMNVADWYFFQGVGNTIGFQRVVLPRLFGGTPDEAVCQAAMPAAHRVFAEFNRLLGVQSYFAGSQASLADIMLGAQMDLFSQAPEWSQLTADRTNLVTWLDRINDRPSFKATTWDKVAQAAAAPVA